LVGFFKRGISTFLSTYFLDRKYYNRKRKKLYSPFLIKHPIFDKLKFRSAVHIESFSKRKAISRKKYSKKRPFFLKYVDVNRNRLTGLNYLLYFLPSIRRRQNIIYNVNKKSNLRRGGRINRKKNRRNIDDYLQRTSYKKYIILRRLLIAKTNVPKKIRRVILSKKFSKFSPSHDNTSLLKFASDFNKIRSANTYLYKIENSYKPMFFKTFRNSNLDIQIPSFFNKFVYLRRLFARYYKYKTTAPFHNFRSKLHRLKRYDWEKFLTYYNFYLIVLTNLTCVCF